MSAMCLAMDPKFELDSQVVERIYLGYQNSEGHRWLAANLLPNDLPSGERLWILRPSCGCVRGFCRHGVVPRGAAIFHRSFRIFEPKDHTVALALDRQAGTPK